VVQRATAMQTHISCSVVLDAADRCSIRWWVRAASSLLTLSLPTFLVRVFDDGHRRCSESVAATRLVASMFQGSWDYRPRLLSVAAKQLMGCNRVVTEVAHHTQEQTVISRSMLTLFFVPYAVDWDSVQATSTLEMSAIV